MATVNTKRKLKSQVYKETVKPTVKKVNKILTSSASNDKRVKRLTKIVENHEFRMMNKTKKLSVLSRRDINGMLKSGIFSLDERKAVVSLIKHSKINTLNENTAKILDSNVSILVEAKLNDSILTEGLFGDIWDGLKDLGDKAKDALKSGWSKVKGIWNEFTDLIKELVEYVKQALKSALNLVVEFAKGKAKELKSKVEAKFKKLEKGAIKKEVGELKETYDYFTKRGESISDGDGWEDKTIKGDFKVDDIKLDDKTIEAGEKELEKIADAIIHKRNTMKLNEDRNRLLSNPEILNALLESRAKRLILSESGGFSHLKDATDNKYLKPFIKYGMMGIGFLMNPIGNAIKMTIEKAGPKLLPKMSEAAKKLGGPGVFAFIALSGLLAEVIEVIYEISHSYLAGGEVILKFLALVTGGASEATKELLVEISHILIGIGVATIVYNLIVGLMDSNPDAAH